MDFQEISRNLHQVWESRPGAVLLLALGFVIFVFVVIDTWFHRRKRKKHR